MTNRMIIFKETELRIPDFKFIDIIVNIVKLLINHRIKITNKYNDNIYKLSQKTPGQISTYMHIPFVHLHILFLHD